MRRGGPSGATVTGIVPSTGYNGADTAVEIVGTGFPSAIDGARLEHPSHPDWALTSVVFVSDTSITAVVPAGAAAAQDAVDAGLQNIP